jgi:hypothetical protein
MLTCGMNIAQQALRFALEQDAAGAGRCVVHARAIAHLEL